MIKILSKEQFKDNSAGLYRIVPEHNNDALKVLLYERLC